MIEWLIQNLGTLLIAAVLTAVIVVIILKLYRDKKQGKTCCGSCEGCKLCNHDGGSDTGKQN